MTGAALGAPPEVRLTLSDSIRTRSIPFVDVAEGVNVLALTGFGILNLADVQQILVDIRGITTDSTFQMMHIEAIPVPEPSTALLIAIGLAAMAGRRRSAR